VGNLLLGAGVLEIVYTPLCFGKARFWLFFRFNVCFGFLLRHKMAEKGVEGREMAVFDFNNGVWTHFL
jgi:hypothetical protein